MGTTQATIVVNFSDGANRDGFFMAELDELGNDGKTAFVPNEEVLFLIQHDETLRILNIVSTNGSVQARGNVTRTKKEAVLFVELGEDQSLPCFGSSSFVFTFNSASLSVDGATVTANTGSFPALCEATVIGEFKQFALLPNIPPLAADATFDVYIVIYLGPA
jgi:hypothetical protein